MDPMLQPITVVLVLWLVSYVALISWLTVCGLRRGRL